MTDHMHFHFQPTNMFFSYDVDIFQCMYSEICIDITCTAYSMETRHGIQFIIPIRENKNEDFKINKTSISTSTGSAEEVINRFLDGDEGKELAQRCVQKLIFNNPEKRATPGI